MSDYHDRTYWRMSSTSGLIEQARNSGNELAIALGERLEEYEAQEATIDDLIKENANLLGMVESRDEEIAYYRAQLGLD
jgi:hypothetical protein